MASSSAQAGEKKHPMLSSFRSPGKAPSTTLEAATIGYC